MDAANWDAYYERRDVFSIIHQLRLSLALAWIDELALPAGAEVLDVGCGTGLIAVALARRGLRVVAVDAAAGMIERAAANVARAGVADMVTLIRADGARLPLSGHKFAVAIALGVVPWVPAPEDVLAEMARSLSPGGYLIVNCDNRYRLPVLLDPKLTPALAVVRATAKRLFPRRPALSQWVAARRHAPSEFDGLLLAAGTPVRRGRTFGFGPFSFLGHEVLAGATGVAVHTWLQRLADLGVPGVRSLGAQYLVLAAKQ